MAERSVFTILAPRYWPMILGFGALWVLSWLPLPVLALLGRAAGMLVYLLHAPRRRIVRENIDLCFPELSRAERRRLVGRHFRRFGQTMFDLQIAWWGSKRRLQRLVSLRDARHLADARAAGRNVILLVPHFIGMEMGGIRLATEYRMIDVYRKPKNKVLHWIMERQRQRFGGLLLEHDKPMTALIRALKSGMPFYYLPDQNAPRKRALFAPFFGIPAATFPALSRLAKITDAVVIPCSVHQLSWGRGYEVVFDPPLADFPSGDDQADTERMNREVERMVRRQPEQYFWVHRRFKTRPLGAPKFYRKKKPKAA